MSANDSFLIQKQMRDNNEDVQRSIKDLNMWEQDVKEKEKLQFGANLSEESILRQKLTREDVEYVKSQFNSGQCQMKAKKWKEAITSFSRAIKKYDKNPMFFLKRAKCYLKLKQAEEAEKDCNESIKLGPNILKAKYLRGEAREMMGNLRGACLDFQDIIILEPTNQAAKDKLQLLKPLYKEEGYELFQNEDKGNCEDNKNGIIEVLAGDENLSNQAELEEHVKLANKAKEEGNTYVREKKYDEAKEAYSRAISLNKNESIYYANRALCHLKTKNEYKASLDCSMALRLNPRYVKAYFRRSMARMVLGDLWGSRQDIKQVLKLEPNNTQAKKDLETLNQLISNHLFKDLEDQLINNTSEQPIKTSKEFQDAFNDQQKGKKYSNELEASSKINKNQVNINNDFIYIYPINKPFNQRSKKSLKRIPIKCSKADISPQTEKFENNNKRYLKDLPDWMLDPSKIKREEEEVTKAQSLNNDKTSITSQYIPIKEIKSDEKDDSSIVGINSQGQDYVEISTVNKKPHQRSKENLKNIPIKFLK